ncbi:RNA polymerase sigma-70 factor (ECF subfamily) [Anseongella ginsenosidimutans]|uniref:RNA polymerase sigma-70 factor (ECF subfamily) n=1 Tax=Anseongella ginsenosidimutans TaxID=496056 RepID=A0A4R3L1N5_9SPHI|nr:RNA polymerase sigma factor [Anseongella ginsenosidimutans]QEC51016.1 RNA polymerase sigma factor [Anseongella ginsenosidimutans]TCS90332.1 RNA polymerase sigma-70 factor (ECF subfamily) [Anseongella ginsenosidimutans]
MAESPDDQLLLERFRNPATKEAAFNELVLAYQQRIYWHVRRMVISHDDADDLVQEIFIRIWKNLETFRGGSKLFTWIYRIATNECISFLKRKKMRNTVSIDDEENLLLEKLREDPYINGNDLQIKLQEAILRLPEKQRIVFNMRYFGELPYEELSEILGTSVGALKASYHHAVKKLEQYFTGL